MRTNEELQTISNLSNSVELVYSNSFFKDVANGGNVSAALSCAGENACYETFKSHLDQLFMLGNSKLSIFCLQAWSTRVDDLVNSCRFDSAVDLLLSMLRGETKALIGLPMNSNLRRERIVSKCIDILYLYVNKMIIDCTSQSGIEEKEGKEEDISTETETCSTKNGINYSDCCAKCIDLCIEIKKPDILFDNIYTLIRTNQKLRVIYITKIQS
jgi:hypothetical protein